MSFLTFGVEDTLEYTISLNHVVQVDWTALDGGVVFVTMVTGCEHEISTPKAIATLKKFFGVE